MGKHLTVKFPAGNSWSEPKGGGRQGLEVEKSKAGRDAAGSGAVAEAEGHAASLLPSEQPALATYRG